MSAAPDPQPLPHPPSSLLAFSTLLLDFDGTLVDIAARPDDVVVEDSLIELLSRLVRRMGNRVAVVSGRSIAQLDTLLGRMAHVITLAGSHGCEYRWDGYNAQPYRPDILDTVEALLQAAAADHPGVLVEPKSYGVGLHYRLAPGFEEAALAMATQLADQHGLAIQRGKMVVEIRVPGSNKGVALRTLMRRPLMAGTAPVFIGDDDTDESGFIAAREHGGAGILVGPERETAALYRLPDPAAVRRWLETEAEAA